MPDWFPRGVLLLLGVGFPVALVLAWALELTPSGIRRDSGRGQTAGAARKPSDYVVVGILALALAYFVVDKLFLSDDGVRPPPEASIAVIPFVNLSRDTANIPFVDGIHDDLLTQLSRIASLRVTSRTSVMRYRDNSKPIPVIAAELGVATVLEAGVQRSGDRVRINAQLIDAETDEHIWAEQYDRQLTAANIFDIQSEIATAIANALQATLTSDDRRRLDEVPTQSFAALDTYFIGKQLLEDRTLESLRAAIEYFEKVVDLDPEFALGWSGLADAYMLLPEYSATIDREMVDERALEAVTRSLALNPDLPEVQATRAWYQLRHYEWEDAERVFREALVVAPDNTNVLHWLSHALSWQGKFDEAVAVARHAVEVEPESIMMRINLVYILADARQYEEALEIAAANSKVAPEYRVQFRNLYLHQLRAGRPRDAAETFVYFAELIGGDPEAARQIGDMFVAYAERGEIGEVSQELISMTKLGSEDLAQILAFVGDAEGTISALQIAAAENSGSRSVFSMKINPAYDFIREDPRFRALLEQVGLAD